MKRFFPAVIVLAAFAVIMVVVIMNSVGSFSLKSPVRIIKTPTTTFNSGPIILDAIKNQAK